MMNTSETASARRPPGRVILAAAALTFTQGVSAVLSFATSSIAARLLGKQDFGLYTFVTANAMLFAVLLDFRGYQWANAIDVARGLGARAAMRRSSVSAVLAVAIGAAFAAVSTLLGYRELWWVVLLAAPALLVADFQAFFQGVQEFRTYNLLSIVKLAMILAGAAGLIFLPHSNRYALLLVVWGVAQGATCVIALGWIRRRGTSRAENGGVRSMDGRSRARAWVQNVISIAATRTELIVVRGTLSTALLGIYAVVFVVIDLLSRAAGSFGTALLPWVASETDASERAVGGASVLLASLVAITGGGLVVLIVGYPATVLFFGGAYSAAYRIIAWHLPGVLLLSAVTVLNNAVASDGYPAGQIVAAIVGILAKVLVLRLFLASAGLYATAAALTVGSGAWLIALFLLCPLANQIVMATPRAARLLLEALRRRSSRFAIRQPSGVAP